MCRLSPRRTMPRSTAVLALLLCGCSSYGYAPPPAPGSTASGWTSLFDGRTTAGWRGYRMDSPPAGAVKPAGEWNAVRLVVNGNHVEHWLNGVKVVEYELGSADWATRVAAGKFAPHARYGKNTSGHIGLQDHGDWVAYRNIQIRVLP